MAIDLSGVVDRAGLAQRLRALKDSSGRSNTQIASDSALSTSGIEGMLGGKNLPNEETVRRFAEACGVDPRPWVSARNRVAAAQPKALRASQALYEDLATLRTHNLELAEAAAEADERIKGLEARVSVLEAAAARRPPLADQWAEARLRLAELIPVFKRVSKYSGHVGPGWRTPLPRYYAADQVDEALEETRILLAGDDPIAFIFHLGGLGHFRTNPWLTTDKDPNEYTSEGGYRVEEVDRFLAQFRAAAAGAIGALD